MNPGGVQACDFASKLVPPALERDWHFAIAEDALNARLEDASGRGEWALEHAMQAKAAAEAKGGKRKATQVPRCEAVTGDLAKRLLGVLQDDESKYALKPQDDSVLSEACVKLALLLQSHVPEATLANEASNWKHWVAFCAHMRTSPWRDDKAANAGGKGHEREVQLLALGLLYIYARMKPARRTPGRAPKPESALAVLRGVRRMHARLGIKMAGLELATRLAASLAAEYCLEHGPEELMPHRTEPLTNDMVDWLVATPHGTQLKPGLKVEEGSLRETSLRACYAVMARTGFRSSEVAMRTANTHTLKRLSRWHLRWRIGGVLVHDPTPEQLRNLKAGDFAILIPPTSKADQFGMEWGPHPIWLRVDPGEAVNAALALAKLELAHPVATADRRATPLFVTGAKTGITQEQLREDFKCRLTLKFPTEAASGEVTLHSFRVYLACCLLELKRSTDEIKALLRWKSDEALRVYARLNAHAYADLLQGVGSVQVDSRRAQNLVVHIGTDQLAQRVVDGASALADAGRRADERDAEGADNADEEPAEVEGDLLF